MAIVLHHNGVLDRGIGFEQPYPHSVVVVKDTIGHDEIRISTCAQSCAVTLGHDEVRELHVVAVIDSEAVVVTPLNADILSYCIRTVVERDTVGCGPAINDQVSQGH